MARVGAAALVPELGFEGRGKGTGFVATVRAISRSPGPSLVLPTPHPIMCLRPGFRQDTQVSGNEARGPEIFFSHERPLTARTGTLRGGWGVFAGSEDPDDEACNPEGGGEGEWVPWAHQMTSSFAGVAIPGCSRTFGVFDLRGEVEPRRQ